MDRRRPRRQPQCHRADTLELALRRQAEVALRHHLTEVHNLGGELSLSSQQLVQVTPEMRALAERSPDTSEHRRTSPTAVR